MGAIERVELLGTPMFMATCSQPATVIEEATYSPGYLALCLKATPDTEVWFGGRAHIPSPSDFGDDLLCYLLPCSEANVLALHASEFQWAPEAAELAERFSCPPERIEEVREAAKKRIIEHTEQAREEALRGVHVFETWGMMTPHCTPMPPEFKEAVRGIWRPIDPWAEAPAEVQGPVAPPDSSETFTPPESEDEPLPWSLRGKRFAGGLAGGFLLGVAFNTLCYIIITNSAYYHPSPDELTFWQGCLYLGGVFAAIGGLAGLFLRR